MGWVLIFLFIQWSIKRRIKRTKNLTRLEKHNLQDNISNYLRIAFFVVVALVWFSDLQPILVSLVAVAAALVLATKEIIMCITGGILIRMSEQFKHGDRIEIDGTRGFVIQKKLTTTKVLEIGPEANSQQTTGRILTIPNSLMLNKVLKNESFFNGYSIHIFKFPVIEKKKLESIENDLLNWANEVSKNYSEEAKKTMMKFSQSEGLDIPSLNPRTKVMLNEEGEIEIILKMAIKNSEVADIEQNLLRKFIKKY